MMQKIQKVLEKLKNSGKTPSEFRFHLFSNFFGDVDRSFYGEDHIEFTTNFCFDSLASYKDTQKFIISSKKFKDESTAYCIAMKDRPFIIDSVLGWIKSESLYPSVFIHPNFFFSQKASLSSEVAKEGYQRYSVVYFELSEPLTQEQEALLKEVLNEVYIATDSYPAMKEWLLDFANKSEVNADAQDFIRWMCDEAFVILGVMDETTSMGICTIEKYHKYIIQKPNWNHSDVVVTKLLMISSVHRRDPLDIVLIKHGNSFIRIYGIFTTHSYRSKLLDIPIVKNKVKEITKNADFQDVNYNRKELFSFLENLPREELFSTSTDFLFDVSIRYIHEMTRGRTFVYRRQSDAFPLVTVAVFTPHTRFTMTLFNKVTKVLQEHFPSKNIMRTFANTQSINKVVMSFFIETDGVNVAKDIANILDTKIVDICENSEDGLIEELRKYENLKPSKIMKKYEGALPLGYTSKHNSKEIARDILFIEQLSEAKPCTVSVTSNIQNNVALKIYTNVPQSLHNIVSVLEQCGIIVFSENPFEILNDNVSAFLHDISGMLKVSCEGGLEANQKFTDLLEKVLLGYAPNTALNKLVVTAQLCSRDIYLMRVFVKYLNQIQFQYQEEVIHEAFARNPRVVNKILELFYAKFDPSFAEDRKAVAINIDEQITPLFAAISNVADDAILRQIYKLVGGIVRTNFFLNKEYISIKIDCKSVPNLPKPVPFREIFVYSLEFEAVHLRFGKVARGGLRWSDRQNDFRTEVLGLVKAQNTKNAVIVPVGSKGGFVITKNVSHLNRDEYLKFGQECYKKFLSGCLDLCDNIIQGKVETPKGIIKWEDEDPYFVVAADKGTATFSDIANSVSAQYNFWLGDAFASGGSNGYDHKKMGITAKGGWIAVCRHMMEMGIDTQKQDFSVVGIGDMSGDVFGNGMLLSKHICLIAAFNHLHIFVDPNPNAEKSFAERERLFNLSRSTWADYNKDLLSKGAMIYERSAKVCKLTPEIKARFEIAQDELSPSELIIYILKSQYDLLWNGGIGTYVKSATEKHTDVGDKANDAIRVNGKDLRCRVIGEGGNLGMTQRGRIEYAQNGGRINTDAMDNSAGVNCSDIEVNIKIVLNQLVAEGGLSLDQRNILLEEMTPEVSRLVLRNNYLQTQAISLISYDQSTKIDGQELMMKKLETSVHLDRENEFLPSTEEISRRKVQKSYLTKPELCVLFAYSKIYLYQELLKSKLIEERYFERDLLNYFPKQMQERFRNDIINHKLAREIIATTVNNSVINRIGVTMVDNISEELQCKPCDVVRAYIVVREVFNLRNIWTAVESLDFKIEAELQTQILHDVNQSVYKCIRILINRNFGALPITKMVEDLTHRVEELMKHIKTFSKESDVHVRAEELVAKGVDAEVALNIATIMEAMQISQIAFENRAGEGLKRYATVYYRVMKDVSYDQISKWIASVPVENILYKRVLHELEAKLDAKYAHLISRISACNLEVENCISSWEQDKEKQLERFKALIADVNALEKQDFAIISMVVDKFDVL